MTVNQFINRLLELQKEGYGEAYVQDLREHKTERTVGIYAPYEFTDYCCWGESFDNKRTDRVYVDLDDDNDIPIQDPIDIELDDDGNEL